MQLLVRRSRPAPKAFLMSSQMMLELQVLRVTRLCSSTAGYPWAALTTLRGLKKSSKLRFNTSVPASLCSSSPSSPALTFLSPASRLHLSSAFSWLLLELGLPAFCPLLCLSTICSYRFYISHSNSQARRSDWVRTSSLLCRMLMSDQVLALQKPNHTYLSLRGANHWPH